MASVDRLHQINTALQHNDSMQQVNDALHECQQVLEQWHAGVTTPQPMTVCPTAVVYDSAAQREQKWALYLQRNPNTAAQYTPADWEQEKAAFGILGNAVHVANQRYFTLYVASTQNPVFSHSWHMRVWGGQDTPDLRAQFYSLDHEWHEFVLVLNQQKVETSPPPCVSTTNLDIQVYIYDPSYLPPDNASRRKLKSVPLLGVRAYKVIAALKTRCAIKEVWLGGGGNTEGHCRKMSLGWVKAGVEEMITMEKWTLGSGWEQVSFA